MQILRYRGTSCVPSQIAVKGPKTRATCVLSPEFDCHQQATWPKCALLLQRNEGFWIWKRKLSGLATVSTISRGPMNEIERLLRPQQV